ncbi:hypothetical protein AMEX_G7045 [Astyanax mexicanus]|uniref:VWFC domain-containing protein n=1 Tax=Astyanax mexicanus TaxID=7994 RepID=A0A8T2M834_ASTMX|nr:hypothetical protein AMEX_G7045 [Astyanax mexicanus]
MTTEKSLCIIKVLSLIVCLDISLTWNCRGAQAAIYRHTGLCRYNNELFEAGQTFFRGCDKCYCYSDGYVCFPPTTPTSWPKKCQRVLTACGFRVVYRDNPAVECRAYSRIW